MTTSQHPRRGFTAIEMIIAIALGSLVVTVAVAGFRVASQTVTLANRLSLQNSILRSAVVAANEDMDTWESFDSPTDTSKQPLRGLTYPFTPMNFTAADKVLDFNPAQGRLWWSGLLWSANRLNDGTNYQRRFGDYSLFGRQGMDTITDRITGGIFPTNCYTKLADLIGTSTKEKTDISNSLRAVPAERSWRHNILPYISDNLGYYAAFDYLPANFVYGYYDDNLPATGGAVGDIPIEFGAPGVGPGRFRPNWHGGNKPLSKVEAGHDNGFILTNQKSGTNGLGFLHPASHRASYNNSNPSYLSSLYPDSWNGFPSVDFTSSLPTNWPRTWIKSKVTYHWMDFRRQTTISTLDPFTGQSTSMTLHGMTTTLRGARRQRDLDDEPVDPNYPDDPKNP